MYKFIFKPFIDWLIALTGLILLSPILFIITIGLLIANRGNPFFIQSRPGKKAKLFNIIKFKTMNDKKDHQGILLKDEIRITQVGKFVRKISLDEIPQLINVLKGEMSIIGPRPLLPEYLSLYNDEQKQRHDVKPGITGWAQVNGRNAISWQQKFNYDIYYVNNLSFLLDIKIIYLTFEKVFKQEGITAENSVSAEVFKGN
jgi:lipopolysaccharide/colanic/teichoic acid biosynthesis glycosyltransferase